jgi:hypothetical protein
VRMLLLQQVCLMWCSCVWHCLCGALQWLALLHLYVCIAKRAGTIMYGRWLTGTWALCKQCLMAPQLALAYVSACSCTPAW